MNGRTIAFSATPADPVETVLLIRNLRARIEDLERELRLARQHLDDCPRWQGGQDHANDKARENA